MTKNFLSIITAIITLALGLSSCGGSEEPQGKGLFTFIANHRIDFAPLVLNSSFAYENEAGNLFKVYDFRYYVSNLRLIKKDGGEYVYPTVNDGSKGYYLVDAADPESKLIILREVPVGEYTGVKFDVGFKAGEVDSNNGVGVLKTSNNPMYTPEYGYFSIFLEGMSYDSPEEDRRIAFRAGGAPYEAMINFQGENAVVKDELETVVEYNVDLAALFNQSAQINFAQQPLSIVPANNKTAAQQFSQAFSFDHLHNNP